ncbi:MAG: ABC transporter ATP-binding protein [Acidimicrobiales bacterium]
MYRAAGDAATAGAAIRVDDLVKRYPKSTSNAVDGMSFSVQPGEIFGLLGPNGAGKTTTVGILTTRVRPTSGQAMVAGLDVARQPVRARSVLGVVPQRNNLDRSLSIRQNLLFHAAYHGVARGEASTRAAELLDRFGLAGRAKDKPDLFSGGQAQRAMIARALMHDPNVLFLDEPTTGLDPAARLFVWERVRELAERGTTVLLTTHDMDEAQALSARVGIVDHGRLLALGTPAELMRSLPGRATLEISVAGLDDVAAAGQGGASWFQGALGALEGVERVEVVGGARLRLYVDGDPAMFVAAVAALLGTREMSLQQVALGSPGLEDVFLHLTGRALR